MLRYRIDNLYYCGGGISIPTLKALPLVTQLNMSPPQRKPKPVMASRTEEMATGEWEQKAIKESPGKFPMLWRHCSLCGAGLLIACGYNALGITRREMLGMLSNEGWTIAPRLICRQCTCPMQQSERETANKMFKDRRIEALNNLALVMRNKYGPIVDKFFLTMNHMDVCYRVGLANAGGSV